MKASISGSDGKISDVFMGSYGIGVSRLVAAIIETSNDEKGIIWPTSVAPFLVNIINLKNKDDNCKNKCLEIHNNLAKNDIESIIDDRDESAGKKFSDSDLIGFPVTIIVGPRELENGNVEIKFRKEGSNQILPYSNVLKIIKKPKILILDEPVTGLDPNQIIEIRQLIKNLGKEKLVLMSSHILQEIEATVDRIIIIDHGNIVADGTTKKLMNQFMGNVKLSLEVVGFTDTKIKKFKEAFNKVKIKNCLLYTSDAADEG